MNTSYRIIELVRARMSNEFLTATDTDISKTLGIGRATISSYKHGKSGMSPETLKQANKILQLSDAQMSEYLLAITLEGTSDPQTRSLWRLLQKNLAGVSTAILAVCALGLFYAFSPGNHEILAFLPALTFPVRYIDYAKGHKCQV